MFPSEHRIGGGYLGGQLRGNETEAAHGAGGAAFTYRGAIAPLAMVPELWDRDFDFDLGYLIAVHEGGSFQHGPTAALSYFAVRQSLDLRPRCGDVVLPDCAPEGYHNLFRLAVRGELDVRFTDAERAPGLGGRLGIRLDFSWLPERAQPVAGATSSRSAFVGASWGEFGLALDVLGGGGAIGTQAYGEVIFALTLRAPAVVGIVFGVP